MIASPLDGSDNPKGTKVGDSLQDITGVVTQAFGYYVINPLTALNITGSAQPTLPPPATFSSCGDCKGLTVGSYNVENLGPNTTHLPNIAAHIVDYLKTPDLMFLQEIQDNTGATDTGGTNSFMKIAKYKANAIQWLMQILRCQHLSKPSECGRISHTHPPPSTQ